VYTALGYLAELKDAGASETLWTANTLDAELHLLQQTAGNGVVTDAGFNADTGLIEAIEATASGGPTGEVASFTYSWDTLRLRSPSYGGQVGDLTGRNDLNQGLAETFQYDILNRLTQYAITGGATKTLTYDDLGNITQKSDVGDYTYPAAGNARPHAVASITGALNTTYAYDLNGNLTSGAGRTVTWTSFNMVASITQGTTTVNFTYGAEQARVKQETNAGTTVYLTDAASGLKVERFEGTGGAVQWNEYLYAGGALVGEHFTTTPAGGGGTTTTLRYFVADHLGSVAVITDGEAEQRMIR
jgi:YD repeat-containing protein